MARTIDKERSEKVRELIEKGELSQKKAMIAAGYSESYANVHGRDSELNTKLVPEARNKFSAQYIKGSVLVGLDGYKAARTLNEIVDNGKDFDKVSAIRVHAQIMSYSQQNISPITNNIFIIPNSQDLNEWKQNVSESPQKIVDATLIPQDGIPKSGNE